MRHTDNSRPATPTQITMEWGLFRQKLRSAADIWCVMLQCSNATGFTHVTRAGIARRTGLTEASVAKQLKKLRSVGLVEDIGKSYQTIPIPGGYTQGWVFMRQVHGKLITAHGEPKSVLVTKRQEKKIMSKGSGGKRAGAGNPGWLTVAKGVDEPLSNRPEAVSNSPAPAFQTDPPINSNKGCDNYVPSKEGRAATPAVEITLEDQLAGLPGNPIVKDPMGPDDFTRPRFKLPSAPPPLGWDLMPKNPEAGAQYLVRLYSSFREHRYGKRLWFRGVVKEQKFWGKAIQAITKMRTLDIRPARWVAWVDGAIWADKKGPPPITVVCNTTLMENHTRWFEGTWESYFYSTVHYPPSSMAAYRLWNQTQVATFLCSRARGVQIATEIDRLVEEGDREKVAIQERLMADIRQGKWVWR